MRKMLSLVVVLCVLLSLSGCGLGGSWFVPLRDYDDFITEFKSLVAEVPEWSILQLRDVPLDDGTVCHIFSIKGFLPDETYRLRVDVNNNSNVTWAFLSTTVSATDSSDLEFAVLAYYTYMSMGFPTMDADAFYKKYDLYRVDNEMVEGVCGAYEITRFLIGEPAYELTFSIKRK